MSKNIDMYSHNDIHDKIDSMNIANDLDNKQRSPCQHLLLLTA